VLAIARGMLPPTTNYERRDPECDLDYVPNHPRAAKIRLALNNSFGFGGTNATIAFRPGSPDEEKVERNRSRTDADMRSGVGSPSM
jgi:acyl transferase domain-containing protein